MIKRLLLVAFLSILVFLVDRNSPPVAADDLSDLKKEVEALKQGQLQLQRELQEINALLRRRQNPVTDVPNVVLPIGGYPSKGSQSARLVLIEFTDYQCPFCARHFQQTSPQIDRDYINTGRVRHVLRDFPLESIHKDAVKAAEAAHCAGDQGQYWQMHDRLFNSQNALGADHLASYAGALGLDIPNFKQCLDSNKYAGKLRQDHAYHLEVRVQTPA